MGEHTEITAKEWKLSRADQDAIAFASHQRAVKGWEAGFFDDLVIPIGGAKRDTIPRKDSTLEKLAKLGPAFDKTSGKGTLTAGNSSPLTDGAAAIWVGVPGWHGAACRARRRRCGSSTTRSPRSTCATRAC
jgi:acetyl-CoA C-acetyltransferase